jgi:hypothetical protein
MIAWQNINLIGNQRSGIDVNILSCVQITAIFGWHAYTRYHIFAGKIINFSAIESKLERPNSHVVIAESCKEKLDMNIIVAAGDNPLAFSQS